jgi:hypothetical protein
METALLIFHLRQARRKARAVGVAEALGLLRDLQATAPTSGPLSERGGLFWISLPAEVLDQAIERLPRLGYTEAVDVLERMTSTRRKSASDQIRWRGEDYKLVRVYKEESEALREQAPDRRVFLFESAAGEVRPVKGYRGDGKPLSRRALPVYDARLLVNLVNSSRGGLFLDPFAGVGGIVLEALASGYSVLSLDVDPALRHGLAEFGARHSVAQAQQLPFGAETIEAIATEPPYDTQAELALKDSLNEMHRVLKKESRLAMLCAAWQAPGLRQKAETLGLEPYLDSPINRKGTDCVVLAWKKQWKKK